jgi:protease I
MVDVSVTDYAALFLPGGTVNADSLRVDKDAVDFVKSCVEAGLPIATICHGPWTLLEANAVRGRRLTSWPSLRTELRCAGA